MSEVAVGELLSRARLKAKLSREALAHAAGTSRSAIAGYENGRQSPTVRTLDRLLAACGLQARVLLEPLMADLDARVDALMGARAELDGEQWGELAASLRDEPQARDGRIGRRAPRRGPVTWAVDGASALTLHQLCVEVAAMDVVVLLDEALRFWMKAVSLVGIDRRERMVQDWYDADHEHLVEGLDGVRYCVLGFVQVRVVTQMPPTVLLGVPWQRDPVPVVTVDEVERSSPAHAEVLARWRFRQAG